MHVGALSIEQRFFFRGRGTRAILFVIAHVTLLFGPICFMSVGFMPIDFYKVSAMHYFSTLEYVYKIFYQHALLFS